MRYWRGGFLYSLCDGLGVPVERREKASRILHNAIKKCFEVDSFANLSTKEFEKIVAILQMIVAREYGYLIRQPDEREYDPNQLTMREFLNKKGLK